MYTICTAAESLQLLHSTIIDVSLVDLSPEFVSLNTFVRIYTYKKKKVPTCLLEDSFFFFASQPTKLNQNINYFFPIISKFFESPRDVKQRDTSNFFYFMYEWIVSVRKKKNNWSRYRARISRICNLRVTIYSNLNSNCSNNMITPVVWPMGTGSNSCSRSIFQSLAG